MATPKIIADFETRLATALAVGGTSFTLASATDDDGVALPSGLYYFTVDNGTSQKEYLAGTLSGTSVTSVLSVSRQGDETSGAAKAHRVGASVIMTDFATYKKYMDEIALVSAPDASTSAKGVMEVATDAEIDSETAAGSTSALLAVSPPQLATSKYGVYLSNMTGVIHMYASTTPPTGFLLCNGQAVNRTTYADLFAVIGTTYGVGDGSTTFNVPDLASRFPLGYSASAPTKVFTFASRSGNLITVTGVDNHANNELQTGQAVVYTSSGSTITGLTSSNTYYVIRNAYNQFSLATSVADANAGTAITLSSDGSGTQLFTATYTVRPMAQKGGEEIHALTDAQMPSHKHDFESTSGSGSGAYQIDSTARDVYSGTQSFPPMTVVGGDVPHNTMPLFTVVNYIIKT